jgi:hypothetical protein
MYRQLIDINSYIDRRKGWFHKMGLSYPILSRYMHI